jgi:hypothetical protein
MDWSETTPGNAATSPSITLITTSNFNEAASYTQLVWDPADVDQPLAGLNNAFTRTFDILGAGDLRFVDGIEVEGQVSLVYNAVPEPASLALTSFALAIAAGARVRSRSVTH